ncbi:hypothetical protein B0T12DRAFT_417373 [Alternaria alternata]|nr:hypothetical protein B0T12DRAFT_417373 [Alternaria alternata]
MPGHGTLEHWTDEDAYVLEREAQLIEYIRKNTAAPVAQVIDYATGHENALGFPHIVMTMLPGKPAYTLWFPEGYPFVGDDDVFRDADVPPPYIKKRRVAFWHWPYMSFQGRVRCFIQTSTSGDYSGVSPGSNEIQGETFG